MVSWRRTWRRWLAPITAAAAVAAALASWAAVDTYRKSILLDERLRACVDADIAGRLAAIDIEHAIRARASGQRPDFTRMRTELPKVGDASNRLLILGPRRLHRAVGSFADALIAARDAAQSDSFDEPIARLRLGEVREQQFRLYSACRSAMGMGIGE